MSDVTEEASAAVPTEWIVPWNGAEYRPDPTDFSGIELSLIKQRIGLAYGQLVKAIGSLDADAIRAVFWIVDRRDNPALNYSDYAGPSMRVVVPTLDGFNASMDALGKAAGMPDETPETSGSASSPSTPDGPETPTTD